MQRYCILCNLKNELFKPSNQFIDIDETPSTPQHSVASTSSANVVASSPAATPTNMSRTMSTPVTNDSDSDTDTDWQNASLASSSKPRSDCSENDKKVNFVLYLYYALCFIKFF